MSLEEDAEKLDHYLKKYSTTKRFASEFWVASLSDPAIFTREVNWDHAERTLRLVDPVSGKLQSFGALFYWANKVPHLPDKYQYLIQLFQHCARDVLKGDLGEFL